MKYKVGDKVRIRHDLSDDEISVNPMMVSFAGSSATITKVYKDGAAYAVDIDKGDWAWHGSMFEGLANDAIKPDYYEKAAMQPLEVMQRIMTEEQFKGFLLGNCIKYRMRKNYKGQRESDEYKARQYAYWLEMTKEGRIINPSEDRVPDSYRFKVV